MSDKTPVENEATGVETVSFEHFGKTWTVPAKVRLSHQRQLRRMSAYPNVDIVEAFLSVKENATLDQIDPTDEQLDQFTDAIAAALGLKNAGNS